LIGGSEMECGGRRGMWRGWGGEKNGLRDLMEWEYLRFRGGARGS